MSSQATQEREKLMEAVWEAQSRTIAEFLGEPVERRHHYTPSRSREMTKINRQQLVELLKVSK